MTGRCQRAFEKPWWSPPVDYLNDDRQMDAPYKDIAARREARKLAIRKRSSSFVVVPSRLTTATFNLTNTIIGSGTLAMPYAAMSSGLCIFPFLVAITGVAAHYAVLCLFNAVENLKGSLRRPRYPSLGRATLGWWGEQIASWSVTFQQLGGVYCLHNHNRRCALPRCVPGRGGLSALPPLVSTSCHCLLVLSFRCV